MHLHSGVSIGTEPLPFQILPHFHETSSPLRHSGPSPNPRTASLVTHSARSGFLGVNRGSAARDPEQANEADLSSAGSAVAPQFSRSGALDVAGSSSVGIPRTLSHSHISDPTQVTDQEDASALVNATPRISTINEAYQVSKAQYDKPRALLSGHNTRLLSVSVRGSVYLWPRRGESR